MAPTYVTVFCDATIDATVQTDLGAVVDLTVRILNLMAEREVDERARETARAGAISEDRVVLRLKPYATFMTPPRHVRSESDLKTLSHWTSSSLPW